MSVRYGDKIIAITSGSTGEATWGSIKGNIEEQVDLKQQLDTIYDVIGNEVEAIDAMLELKAEKTQITDLNNHLEAVEEEKQDVITDLETIRTNSGKVPAIEEKIKDIELFKFPNADIIGEPTITNGNISGFSVSDYLQFPFVVDVRNRPFRIEFSFTTGSNITTQQNILDSYFGLALALRDGKGLMAVSTNGTSWAAQAVGTTMLQPNTTYYVKLSWNGMLYQTEISTDGIDYTRDMYIANTSSPFPRTMYIGASPNLFGPGSSHPFTGVINLNRAYLYIDNIVVWQGMDDAGLSTRADVSLSNLDSAGLALINTMIDNKLLPIEQELAEV